MKRLAAGFVLAAILGGGAYAVASEELGWSIKKNVWSKRKRSPYFRPKNFDR